MRKKVIFLVVLVIPIVGLLSRFLWPVLWTVITSEYVCTPYTVSYDYVAGYEGYPESFWEYPGSSSTGYDCYWFQYSVTVDYTSGDGTDVQPPEPDPGTAGGDSGSTDGNSGNVTNTYDRDNDGVIDCYKDGLFRLNDIAITQRVCWTAGDSYHPGVDFDSASEDITGQSVYSATNGTVYAIPKEESASYGWWIEIKADDGSIWKYCHLLEDPKKTVSLSQRVNAGKTVIGKADHTGKCYGLHEGAHLHLECSVNGVPIDPLTKLQNACFE